MKYINSLLIGLALFVAYLFGNVSFARDYLTIGITQFPSSFHPNIDNMLAKAYIQALTRRPLTVYNDKWKLQCMLCIKLPTLENGLAKKEIAPNGRKGVAVTYTLHPNATWGDGSPVTTKDIIFIWNSTVAYTKLMLLTKKP